LRAATLSCLRFPFRQAAAVTRFSIAPEMRLRYPLALTAGILLALAFPKWSLAGAAWIAPGVLLFSALGQGGGRAFRLGWWGGFAFNLAALYWLLNMPVAVAPVFGWLALSAYCALYPALWVWLAWQIFPGRGKAELRLDDFLATSWLQRLGWAMQCAALWVAAEFILGRFLTGFPWLPLGMSQYKLIPLVQTAAVTGVHGLSFMVVWFAVSLGCALIVLVRRPATRRAALHEVRVPLFVLVLLAGAGVWRVNQSAAPKRELAVALVQPSIPQTMIWDPAETTNRFNKLLQLSEAALLGQPDVLIWPEAALPSLNDDNLRAITNLVAAHKVWMIFGADDVELRPGAAPNSQNPDDYRYFNAAILFDPAGRFVASYRKRRLVIFGEYVPLAAALPFLKWLTPIQGGFTPGDRPVSFTLASPAARLGMLICYEDIFPSSAREGTDADTDFLLNLTNDGWFGESAAQWQHAANAVFRAVENGLPLVRCTNNGLTCWIDSVGRMHETRPDGSADIYAAGFKTARIPLGGRPAPTFYHRHGDWFGWSCLGLAAVRILRLWPRRRRGDLAGQTPVSP